MTLIVFNLLIGDGLQDPAVLILTLDNGFNSIQKRSVGYGIGHEENLGVNFVQYYRRGRNDMSILLLLPRFQDA